MTEWPLFTPSNTHPKILTLLVMVLEKVDVRAVHGPRAPLCFFDSSTCNRNLSLPLLDALLHHQGQHSHDHAAWPLTAMATT